MLMEHDSDVILWKWDSCTHDPGWKGDELNFMDPYAILLLFPWQYALLLFNVNYYWVQLVKQYGDTPKWENIYFPKVVLELCFFSSLCKIWTWLNLKFWVKKSYPWISVAASYLVPPGFSSTFVLLSSFSIKLSDWSLSCQSLLRSGPSSGLPSHLPWPTSCCLSLISCWLHWTLLFLDHSKHVCVMAFLSPVPRVFSPTLLKNSKPMKKVGRMVQSTPMFTLIYQLTLATFTLSSCPLPF